MSDGTKIIISLVIAILMLGAGFYFGYSTKKCPRPEAIIVEVPMQPSIDSTSIKAAVEMERKYNVTKAERDVYAAEVLNLQRLVELIKSDTGNITRPVAKADRILKRIEKTATVFDTLHVEFDYLSASFQNLSIRHATTPVLLDTVFVDRQIIQECPFTDQVKYTVIGGAVAFAIVGILSIL